MHVGYGVNDSWKKGKLSWLFLLIGCFCLWALVFQALVELCLIDNNVSYVALIFLIKIHKVVCGSGHFERRTGFFVVIILQNSLQILVA